MNKYLMIILLIPTTRRAGELKNTEKDIMANNKRLEEQIRSKLPSFAVINISFSDSSFISF
jgi:hypothetical protein